MTARKTAGVAAGVAIQKGSIADQSGSSIQKVSIVDPSGPPSTVSIVDQLENGVKLIFETEAFVGADTWNLIGE
ncbi:hypothetical protein V490_09329 [Pseudogymnoascus sp. VKM F-3557]|nr:hypothetical protein V490_09329 [Pseudogymnoascus sp. VKM F-3557]